MPIPFICVIVPKKNKLFSISYKIRERLKLRSANKFAKSTEEFDRRFDEDEDIHDLVDMAKAKIIRHRKKVRINLDMAEELVQEIDQIRQSIGVDRAALIKIWLPERVPQEKANTSKHWKKFI